MKKRAGGFTLIELLVVIAIISLLSSVVMSALNSARATARDSQRIMSLRQVRTALDMYYSNNGSYPSTGHISNVYIDPGCPQTVTSPDTKTASWVPSLVPTYIAELPVDPKPINGGCYMYSSDGTKYLLTAWGTVEASSNGGRMNSDFGYRELNLMATPICFYSTNYPSVDAVHRKSFTITNLTTDDFAICSKLGT